MKGIRTRRGELQSAVLYFYRETDNRHVRLMGTVHIAERRYFEELRRRINQEFFRIQYERVIRSEALPVTDDERAALKTLDEMQQQIKAIGAALDLVHQGDALGFDHDWKHTDITDLEAVRLMGPSHILRRFEDMPDLTELLEYRLGRWFLRFLLRNLAHLAERRSDGGLDASVVLDYRNMIAVNAILAAERNVLAIWGAGHLPGIGERLERNGFRLIHTEWITAVGR